MWLLVKKSRKQEIREAESAEDDLSISPLTVRFIVICDKLTSLEGSCLLSLTYVKQIWNDTFFQRLFNDLLEFSFFVYYFTCKKLLRYFCVEPGFHPCTQYRMVMVQFLILFQDLLTRILLLYF